MKMKKEWRTPKVADLNVRETLNSGFDVVPFQSVNSCDQTLTEAVKNQGKGCSFTGCEYYSKNNNGQGKGGKCGGATINPDEPSGGAS